MPWSCENTEIHNEIGQLFALLASDLLEVSRMKYGTSPDIATDIQSLSNELLVVKTAIFGRVLEPISSEPQGNVSCGLITSRQYGF